MSRTLSALMLLCLGLVLAACSGEQSHKLQSPDGRIAVTLELNDRDQLLYSIQRDGSVVLQPSQMGLVLADRDLSRDLRNLSAGATSQVRGDYAMVQGKQRVIDYRANEQVYRVENADGETLQVTLRIFDNGVAFRYRVAGDTPGEYEVQEETISLARRSGDTAREFVRSEVETGGAIAVEMQGHGGFIMKFPAAGLAKN